MREVIYRIEHPSSRKGPYWDRDWAHQQELGRKHDLSHDHQTPNMESGGAVWMGDKIYRCGFFSLADASWWFDGWINLLSKAGFVLSTYSADVKWRGERQLVFAAASALLLSESRLTA